MALRAGEQTGKQVKGYDARVMMSETLYIVYRAHHAYISIQYQNTGGTIYENRQ